VENKGFFLEVPVGSGFFAAFCVSVGLLLGLPGSARAFDQQMIAGCVPCHGADGISRFGEAPNLAGQNAPYLLNQLRAFHTGKRVHREMHYMSRNLTEAEMEAIAAYFSGLPPR
jgi:cytochrome c553